LLSHADDEERAAPGQVDDEADAKRRPNADRRHQIVHDQSASPISGSCACASMLAVALPPIRGCNQVTATEIRR